MQEEQAPEQRLTIKNWAADDRPREKALEKGWQALSDAELLAILIATGSGKDSAVDLAKKLLKEAENDINKLGRFNIAEMKKVKGIGDAKALTIGAALEIGGRRKVDNKPPITRIRSSIDVYNAIYPYLKDVTVEQFWILLLNQSNTVIKMMQVSIGGVSQTVTDPRVIFKAAINELAAAVILIHNHPSGNTEPSEQDKKMTESLMKGGKIIGVKILDHLIFADEKYYSFQDNGLLF